MVDLDYDGACVVLHLAVLIRLIVESGVAPEVTAGVVGVLRERHHFSDGDIEKFFEAGQRQVKRTDEALNYILLANMPMDGARKQ